MTTVTVHETWVLVNTPTPRLPASHPRHGRGGGVGGPAPTGPDPALRRVDDRQKCEGYPGTATIYAILSGMRTTLELDDSLMEALMARSPGTSKTKAVEAAITDYLHRDAARGMRELRGTIAFQDPDYWRKARRAEVERRRRRSA
jgi:Arc/MetJ family transcription regulator